MMILVLRVSQNRSVIMPIILVYVVGQGTGSRIGTVKSVIGFCTKNSKKRGNYK